MLKRNNTWEALPITMTTFEVAEILRCCPESVRRYLANGDLEGFKIKTARGGSWRVSREALKKFIERGSAR